MSKSKKYRKTKLHKFKDITTIQGQQVAPGRYLVGDNGEIYNLITRRPLTQEISRSGHKNPKTGRRNETYYRVTLTMADKSRKHFLTHRIVAEYYCPNDDPDNKTYVDHLNDDKRDNNYVNLEWVTPRENAIRSYDRGTSHTKGEQCHLTVYSDDQVHEMCRLLEQGQTPTQIIQTMGLMDIRKYRWGHPLRTRLNSYIKKLRSGTFRKDITSQYNLKGSTTIER